ncbi:MAG: R3H domain-containing nucleic acid-binding protein [Candidatus Moraniibacteriota bacterium]
MAHTHPEIIKDTVAELLEKMGFDASVEMAVEEGAEGAFLCRARVEHDQNLLIGQYGANLAAIQHLVRVMLRKKIAERVNVIVDINDYFAEKRLLLEKEARLAAQEAVRDNAAVTLRPMLPYERKIVHTALAENQEIITESAGAGDARRVVIRPKPIGSESLA